MKFLYNASMYRRVIPSLFLFSLCLSAADPKWIRMKSDHFEMYSSAGERQTREMLKSFEQVRTFFLQLIPVTEEHPIPVRMVLFGSDKEYEPYKMNSFTAAYYLPGAEHDTIVMGRGGEDSKPIAIHEYTHLVLEHAGLKPPLWLNEGLAEVFSTMRPSGNKVMIGELLKGRMQEILINQWVPLPVILNVDHESPYYNEKNRAGMLYGEGWALTHMLMFEQRFAPKFDMLLGAIQKGETSDDAIARIYGMPISTLDQELQAYVRGDRFFARLYPTKLEKVEQELRAEPAEDFDVQVLLTELETRPGKEEEARKKLEGLLSQSPKRPEPWAQLGYMAWRRGNTSEAAADFEKAYELGDRSRRMLWDYGRMAEPKSALRPLSDLLRAEPERTEVRVALAGAYIRNKQPGTAVATLSEAKTVTRPDAPGYFLTAAYAFVDLRDFEKARANLDRALPLVKDSPLQAEAQRMDEFLKNLAEAKKRGQDVIVATGRDRPDAGPPTLVRAAVAPPASPREPKVEIFPDLPSAEGLFVTFLCDDRPKIVLLTSSGKKTFLIEDPGKIVVVGKAGGKVDLNCGDQTGVPLKVEYEQAPAGEGLDGFVRKMLFQ